MSARIDELADLPAAKWKRISCGTGAHGPRLYDWARLEVRPVGEHGFGHWILARRSISDPTELAYYVCYAPARTTLAELARIAGRRWPVEECFQQAKNETGLTTTRSATGAPGTPTSPCPWPPTPCWPSPRTWPQRGNPAR